MRQSPEDLHLIGSSPAFLDLMDHVSQVAPLDRPILVVGERGTGKELIGARLHFLSRRWERNFIKLNCAALPETLLESEMFGYEPGAFTGAQGRRAGRFEQADGGTLFLDEIATMSPAAQEKLLRVVEYGEFERLGGSETIKVDVRVIGATNVDLPARAATGGFRRDLLDRLAFDVITVPPLRARPGDIMELATYFARSMAAELDWAQFPGFAPDAAQALMTHDWPGNVRELRNVAERATAFADSPDEPVRTLDLDPFESPWRPEGDGESRPADDSQPGPEKRDDRPPAADKELLPAGDKPFDFRRRVQAVERHLLARAMEANRFNKRRTADFLGLSYDQLRHALKKHQLL